MKTFHSFLVNALLALLLFTVGCGKSASDYMAQAVKLEAAAKTEDARLLYAKALQANPKAFEADYRLGLLDQSASRLFPALEHFEHAIESGQLIHLQAFARLGLQLYLASPESQKLYTSLKKVSGQLRPLPGGQADAWRIDGYLAVMEKRGVEAIASFEKAVAADTEKRLIDVPVALLQQLLGAKEQNKANLLLDRLVPGSAASASLLDTYYLHELGVSGCTAARPVLERKAALPGQAATARLQLAAHERRCHGPRAEAAEIEIYLSQAKDRDDAELHAGDYYAEQGDWQAALAAFDRVSGARSAALDNRRASALMGLGRMSEAATALDRLIASKPGDASARAQRGLLRMFGEVSSSHQSADFEAGLEDLRTALAQDPTSVPPQIRLQWVLGLTRNQQYPEARAELQKILAAAPTAIAPQLVLAQLDLRDGKAQSARKICEQILSESPGLREARLIRALSLKQLNATGEAKAELAKLSSEFPRDESIAVQYLALLAEGPDANNGALARGLEDLRRSPKLKSDTLYLLAEIYWRIGRPADGIAISRQIYAKTGDTRALLRMSELRMSGGEMAEGCRDLASIGEIGKDSRPNLQASWWGLSAVCRESQKDFTGALAAHRKALEIQPKDPVLNNNLAAFLSGQKQDLDQAVTLAQVALQASPNEAEFLDTLGWIYFQKRDLENSKSVYRRLAAQPRLSAAIREHQQLVLGTR